MKEKAAIFTVDIGNGSDYFPAMLSAQYYADRYGINYFVSRTPSIRFLYPPFEKHQCFKLFDMGYDRVLILDRDILITPAAPNIFECFPDVDTLYAFDENAPDEMMNRDPIVKGIKGSIDWPKNEMGMYKYFNSGVVIISKNFKDFAKGFRELPETRQMRKFPEQTSMNYLAFKKGIKFEDTGYKWNRMHFGNADPQSRRYEAYFIHYAGFGQFVPELDKLQTIRRDFIHFYGQEALKAGAGSLSYQMLPAESSATADNTSKRCSIFFLCEPESVPMESGVNSFLQHLSANKLPADCELLFTEEHLKHIEPTDLEPFKESIRTISVIEQLGFDQTCIDIARQAEGKYVIFLEKPTGWDEILQIMRKLENSQTNIAVGSGKFIIVNRGPFMKSQGFKDLINKSGV